MVGGAAVVYFRESGTNPPGAENFPCGSVPEDQAPARPRRSTGFLLLLSLEEHAPQSHAGGVVGRLRGLLRAPCLF